MTTQTPPPVPPADLPDIDEAFRARVSQIYDEWQTTDLPFNEAYKRLKDLEQEAIAAGEAANQAGVYNTLGIMYGYRSRYDQSIEHFQKAAELFQQAGAKRRLATVDLNIGETYRLIGNYTQARRFFRRAFNQARELDNVPLEVTALTNEGQVWLSLNSAAQARETLTQALELTEERWQPENERDAVRKADNACEIHVALVAVMLADNDYDGAWKHARHAYDLAEFTARPVRQGYAARVIGDVITAMGSVPDDDFDNDPDAYYKAATDYFKQVKADGEIAKTLYSQGKSMVKRNKRRSAGHAFQQAMVLFTRLGMTTDAAKAAEAQLDTI